MPKPNLTDKERQKRASADRKILKLFIDLMASGDLSKIDDVIPLIVKLDPSQVSLFSQEMKLRPDLKKRIARESVEASQIQTIEKLHSLLDAWLRSEEIEPVDKDHMIVWHNKGTVKLLSQVINELAKLEKGVKLVNDVVLRERSGLPSSFKQPIPSEVYDKNLFLLKELLKKWKGDLTNQSFAFPAPDSSGSLVIISHKVLVNKMVREFLIRLQSADFSSPPLK